LLWNRSRNLREELKNLITEEPPRQNIDAPIPVIKLMIFHDVWKTRDSQCSFVDEVFYKTMSGGDLVFDTFYPTNAGYLARQARFNNPLGLVFGWHHRRGCVDEITIPFNTYRLDDEVRIRDLGGYKHAQSYVTLCHKAGARETILVDLSIVYSLLLSICLRLNDILLKENVGTDINFKLQISGMSGCVPFLDVPDFVRAVEVYGIPVIQEHVMYAPPGFTPETLEPLLNIANPGPGIEQDRQYFAIMNCVTVFFTLCRALGVDLKATGFDGKEESVSRWHERLIEAANRFYGISAVIRDREGKRSEE
jgi:hypothetical protein